MTKSLIELGRVSTQTKGLPPLIFAEVPNPFPFRQFPSVG